jgi:hypothetical protein
MGIRINERKERDGENYSHLLTVEYATDVEERSSVGTVFGSTGPRIVRNDLFFFEVNPDGIFLFYTNIDKPGMFAKVAQFLPTHPSILRASRSVAQQSAEKP